MSKMGQWLLEQEEAGNLYEDDGWGFLSMKVTIVEPKEFLEEGYENEVAAFVEPSTYFFVDAMGNRNYLHTRDRALAQEYINENYGGKYTVRTNKTIKPKGDVSAVGHINSKSRQGMRKS